jgi:hypothetical protein
MALAEIPSARTNGVGTKLPSNFGFVYETGYGEKIDTFSGTVTKDLVSEPDRTIRLRLSKRELRKVYEAMVQHGLFAVAEPHPAYRPNCSQDPHTTHRFEITAGDVVRQFSWSDEWCPGGMESEWGPLYRVLGVIRSIVESRAEYRRLPDPKAVYL